MTEDKKLDPVYTTIDLGDRRFITAIQGFTLCDPINEGSRPCPIILSNEEIIEERIGKLEEGIATFAIASPYGTKEYVMRKLKPVDDTVVVFNGVDFCKMENEDATKAELATICFKLSSEPDDDLSPVAYDFDEAAGSGLIDLDGKPRAIACYTRETIEVHYLGDKWFLINIIGEDDRVVESITPIGLNNSAAIDPYLADVENGAKFTVVTYEDVDGEIKLGDEGQLDAILTTMAELEEIQEVNEGTLEEDPEINKEVDAIFKASPMLKDLEGNEFNLLGEGSIEKVKAILDTLKQQLLLAKKALNKKVLQSQLPKEQRQRLMRELTQELKPIEAQIEQFEALIPELITIKETLALAGKMSETRNAALEETKETAEPK